MSEEKATRLTDRRRRQDWRRLEDRWVKRFKRLEPVKQHALLEALQAILPAEPATTVNPPAVDPQK